MAPTKKAAGTAAAPKKSSSSQLSYKDMIKGAILALKERNGSSRQALKKYIQGNFKPTLTGAQFDSAFNKAIKTGVEKGDFTQPKGPSGPVKLAKKEPAEKKAKPAAKTGEAKKATTTKKSTTKTAAKPKSSTTTAATTSKKPAAKTGTAAKPKKATTTTTKKANTGTKRKTPSSAPAVVEQKTVINKTKSGRVSKGKEPTPGSTSAKRSAAGKKGAAKSPAIKKTAPAKAEA